MPRRARSFEKHLPNPDPKFSSVKYSKFINYLMERGKKTTSQRIFYDALDIVTEKMKDQDVSDARQIFDIALKNVAPLMEIKGRRIGGSNYQVPMEVQEPRRTALGMKWMIAAARARKGAPMREKLAYEIVDAFNKIGAAVKKRDDTHRMAEANKAFAHFARFGNKRK
ncbi:MAG TPA: 30S ribosomal protein S7 [Patescibacteria group bacterium]|jgi:small subunit ribosomal protein S7|nr:30S ribosomal protein S7 [Patescibacteria group bacterium]